ARAGDAGQANVVAWAAEGPNRHAFADPARGLKDVLDFKEVAGASLKEFQDWHRGLGQEFRLALLSSRRGAGPPLFNAVAVREAAPPPQRLCLDMPEAEADRSFDPRVKEGYRPLARCGYVKSGQVYNSQIWLNDGMGWSAWFSSLESVIQEDRKSKAEHFR